jgi:hypothetical protein
VAAFGYLVIAVVSVARARGDSSADVGGEAVARAPDTGGP